MSATDETRDPAAPPPPPPLGVDRVEFRRALNDAVRAVEREGANTRQFIGWFAATIGLLIVFMGVWACFSKDGGWS